MFPSLKPLLTLGEEDSPALIREAPSRGRMLEDETKSALRKIRKLTDRLT